MRPSLALLRDSWRALGTRRALLTLPAWQIHRSRVLVLDLERTSPPPPAPLA